jgi:RHS repeat-associated protein
LVCCCGRDQENDQFVNSSSYIQVLKTYDAMGRPYTTSTPAVPGSGFSQSWLTTYYPYDGLGRITQVTIQGDSAATTTAYSANQTTVTDQANVQRSTWTDGLGRLIQVEEAPASDKLYTTYQYDALNDLTCVNQGALGAVTANPQIYSCQTGLAHSRSFTYTGIGQLKTATNPESGTLSYTYDPVGNLLTKTDAASVVTTTTYDALNRPTVKSFSDGVTPQVTYSYDAATLGINRLNQITSSASTTNFPAYNALGHIASSNQITQGTTYTFPSYQYNLAGALLSETLPSGRVIATGYDGANRLAYLQGNFGTSTTPYIGNKTNPIQYWPHGVPYKVPLGNGLWHTLWLVNGHLQPTAYWDAVNDNGNDFLRIEYPNWVNGSGQNNGNLQGTTIWAGGPSPSANLPQFSESFTYDGENRLTSASDSGGWSRGFSYDQWGNMAVTANNGVPAMNVNTPQSLSLFNANNQRTDQTYFPNGNLKSIQPGITLAYDAENRQTSAGGYSYSYDGAGHRVAKIGGGATTIYVYDAAGQLAEEYAPGSAWKKDYVRLGSQLIAEEYNGTVSASMPCTTCYFTYDHLGTVRLITDQNANVISRHDYLPFGEEIPANTAGRGSQWGPGNDTVTQKFTGKERDQESGLDYFGARYYGSALGRWTSPDWSAKTEPVPYAKLDNPQTLNLYAYVGNNPLGRPDLDGHDAGDPYKTKDEAGAAAAKDAAAKTAASKQPTEYGGRLYEKRNGTYSYTKPKQGEPNTGQVERADPKSIPKGTSDAGAYHSHPAGIPHTDPESFSSQDKTNSYIDSVAAKQAGDPNPVKPEYLGTPTQVLKFTPDLQVQPGHSDMGETPGRVDRLDPTSNTFKPVPDKP